MTELVDVLAEVRKVGTKVDVLTERVAGQHETHAREQRATHARIDEVKGDLTDDIRDLRTNGRKAGVGAGLASATGLVALVEIVKRSFGINP